MKRKASLIILILCLGVFALAAQRVPRSIETPALSAGEAFVVGEVRDDATGLPLSGARARLVSTGDGGEETSLEVMTDGDGRYRFPVNAGPAAVVVTRPGYSSAYRETQVEAGEVGRLLDVRLSRLAPATSFNPLVGANLSLQGNSVQLTVPPGAFTQTGVFMFTRLGFQALPAPLPAGWSPVSVVHLGPEGRIPNAALSLKFEQPAGAALVAVRWDANERQWIRVATEAVTGEDTLGVEVATLGVVALVRPDQKPVAPKETPIGEALDGVSVSVIPKETSAEIVSGPEVLFMQPGARSEVRVTASSAEPLSSGTRVEVDIQETYLRRDGDALSPELISQDVVLYQGADGLGGRFTISPAEIFDAALLREGAIRLDVHRPGELEGSAVIDATGASVSSPAKITLEVPPGALATNRPVSIRPIPEPRLALPEHPRFKVVAGFAVEFGGASLTTSGRVSFTLGERLPKGAQLLVIQPVRVEGVTRYELVGTAITRRQTLTMPDPKAVVAMEGVRTPGRYYVVQATEPVGFMTGKVNAKGGLKGAALVRTEQSPFVSLAEQEDPRYVLAVPVGTVAVSGKDLGDGRAAMVSGALEAKDRVATLDLSLETARPTVASLTPIDGSTGVRGTTPISVRFSRAMDRATITAESFSLRTGEKEVAGKVTVLADALTAVLRPAQPLADEVVHTVVLSGTIRDSFGNPLFGNQPDGSYAATFTTLDTTPPPPPEPGQIRAGPPDDNGIAVVTGTQGTVERRTVVTVRNTKTDVLTTTVASDDGSFSVSIAAGLTDDLELLLVDDAGNETVIDIGRVTPPPGTAVLGEEGGVINGKDGISADVPAGVLPPDTVVKIEPLDVAAIAHPFSRHFPGFIAGAVRFDMGDIEIPGVAELRLSIDGFPESDVVDLVPSFRIERDIALPADLEPGSSLTMRVSGRDLAGRSAEGVIEVPVVENTSDSTARTETFPGSPVLSLSVPASVSPGEKITVAASADPPNVRLRFPAPPILTGKEQYLLFELRDMQGKPFWDLADRGQLVTLNDGTHIIETTSPPYRGIRGSRTVIMTTLTGIGMSYVPVWFVQPIVAPVFAFVGRLSALAGLGPLMGTSLNADEFSVVPVRAGVPGTIEIIDPATNARVYRAVHPALPPDTLGEVLILGEDENDLLVTGVTSQANHAVPTDAGVSLSFSHLVDTGSANDNNLFIEELSEGKKGKKIEAERKYPRPIKDPNFIVMVKPLQPLNPGKSYKLVAEAGGIKRPNGRSLKSRFELPFTTTQGKKLIGSKEIAGARTFDVVGDVVLVTARDLSAGQEPVNRLVTVSVADPTKPKVLKQLDFDPTRDGPIWAVKAAKGGFKDHNGRPVPDQLALVTMGNSGTFSTLRLFDVAELQKGRDPKPLSTTKVSVPLDVLHGSIGRIEAHWVSELLLGPIPVRAQQYFGAWVSDLAGLNLNGIPMTTAIPWMVDTRDHMAYFVSQGTGIVTVDLAEATPTLPPALRGREFGPSFIPEDKAGAIVIRKDDSTEITGERIELITPQHWEEIANNTKEISVKGRFSSQEIDEILVNGFRADIDGGKQGATATFEVAQLPLREGINRISATAFASGAERATASRFVVRQFETSVNPLAGNRTIKLNLPPLNVVGSGTEEIQVTARLEFDEGRPDQIYVNGLPAANCKVGAEICEGTVTVPLEPGINTVVATAIDLHEEFPEGYNFSDLRVEEGLVLGVKNGLHLFDAGGLVKMGITKRPPKPFSPTPPSVPLEAARSVSVVKNAVVDVDDDGTLGLAENTDGDDKITVFNELKNLALIGGGAAKVEDKYRLTFVDITEPHRAKAIGWMPSETPVYRAVAIPGENLALVAADTRVLGVDLAKSCYPDINQCKQNAGAAQSEQKSAVKATESGSKSKGARTNAEQIRYEIPANFTGPGVSLAGGVQDIRLDPKRGLAYLLHVTKGKKRGDGVSVLRLESACTQDAGIDATYTPTERHLRYATLEQERDKLFTGIEKGLAHPACRAFNVYPEPRHGVKRNAALLAQGSSACIWQKEPQCSTAYQPGLSDYDFEFIVARDKIPQAKACGAKIEEAIHAIPELEQAEVSVFPVRDSVVETAYRDVRPVAPPGDKEMCGGGDDPYADLCLGRNGNILKWLLEGEWVSKGDIKFNNGILLDDVVRKLAEPITKDSLRYDPKEGMVPILKPGADDQPSHVPLLEGKEWACLEDFALNQSAARIRIKGVGIGDVPIQSPFYHKKIHKAAKAGIRTMYGKLLASELSNAQLLSTSRKEYRGAKGCFTATKDPATASSPADFSHKPCESFTEYIASNALLSAKNGSGIITEAEAMLAYEMYRRKADVGPQIRDEEKANQFIIKVMKFIGEVRKDGKLEAIYDTTVKAFSDGDIRKQSLRRCEEEHLPKFLPEKGASELKLKIPVRLYNGSYVGMEGVQLALLHDGKEEKRVVANLRAGESVFYPRKGKETKRTNGKGNKKGKEDAQAKKKEKKDSEKVEPKVKAKEEKFQVKPKLTGAHKVQFVVDPESRFTEYDRNNNNDGFHYYVLYPEDNGKPPKVPDRPALSENLVRHSDQPSASATEGSDQGKSGTPQDSAMCLVDGKAPPSPRLELISMVNDQYETAVERGETVKLEWIVRNRGNRPLKKLKLNNSLVGQMAVPDIKPGGSETLSKEYKVPDEAKPVLGVTTIQGLGPRGNGVGPTSSVVKINVVKPVTAPPVVRILGPRKSDPPYTTSAKAVPVWGIVESHSGRPEVKINDIVANVSEEGTPSKRGEGIKFFRFETVANQPIRLEEDADTVVVATATDRAGAKSQDKVTVRHVVSDLRVTKLVNGKPSERAEPGDTVTYTVEVIAGKSKLYGVEVRDPLMKDRPDPFDLNPGQRTKFSYKYKIPEEGWSSPLINTVRANGFVEQAIESGNGKKTKRRVPIPTASAYAEVLVNKAPYNLLLEPTIVLIANAQRGPKAPVPKSQLKVTYGGKEDGKWVEGDVTNKVAYHVMSKETWFNLGKLATALFEKELTQAAEWLWEKVAGQPRDKSNKVLNIADISVDAKGELSAKSNGFNIIWATYSKDGNEYISNYSIVLVGMAELDSIEIAPRSVLTAGPLMAKFTTNLISERIHGKAVWQKNPPLLLGSGGPLSCSAGWPDRLTQWMGTSAYATLSSVKFRFFYGPSDYTKIDGVDLLVHAQNLIQVVSEQVGQWLGGAVGTSVAAGLGATGVGAVVAPLAPVIGGYAGQATGMAAGFMLQELFGYGVTQWLVDFERSKMNPADSPIASLRKEFPSGIVTAKPGWSGCDTVTGTVDLSKTRFGDLGKKSDDMLVLVGPSLHGTEVRVDETKVAKGGTAYVETHLKLGMRHPAMAAGWPKVIGVKKTVGDISISADLEAGVRKPICSHQLASMEELVNYVAKGQGARVEQYIKYLDETLPGGFLRDKAIAGAVTPEKEDNPKRVGSISFKVKGALELRKEGANLTLDEVEMGFPAPNLFVDYKNMVLDDGTPTDQIATLVPLDEHSDRAVGTGLSELLTWQYGDQLRKQTGLDPAQLSQYARGPLSVLWGAYRKHIFTGALKYHDPTAILQYMTVSRLVKGKEVGIVHLGAEACFPFVGNEPKDWKKKGAAGAQQIKPVGTTATPTGPQQTASSGTKKSGTKAQAPSRPDADLYDPNVGEGGAEIIVLEDLVKEGPKCPDPKVYDAEIVMNQEPPNPQESVNFVVRGKSPYRLKFELVDVGWGELKGLPATNALGGAAVTYTPRHTWAGFDNYSYRITDTVTGKDAVCRRRKILVRNDGPDAVKKTFRMGLNKTLSDQFEGSDLNKKHKLKLYVDPPSPDKGTLNVGPSGGWLPNPLKVPFDYTPERDFSGQITIPFEVSDGYESEEGLIEINVNYPPECQDVTFTQMAHEGEKTKIPITASDKDGDDIGYRIVSQPARGTVTAPQATFASGTTATVEYTADSAAVGGGTDSFKYIAYDVPYRDESSECTVTVTINEAPTALSKQVVVQKNSSGNTIVLEAKDHPDDTLTFNFDNQSKQGGTIVGGQQLGPHQKAVDYAPAKDYTGPDSFQFRAKDQKLDSKPGNIGVRVNSPPLADDDTAVTNEGVAIDINVLENDVDLDGIVLAVVEVEQVPGAQISIVPVRGADRTKLRFAPLPNAAGAFEFKYTIMDNDRAFGVGKVTVTVVPVNEAPKVVDDSATTNENQAIIIDVLSNDTDPDGDVLSVGVVSQGAHGRVYNQGVEVRYEPNADFSGIDTFTYTADDNNGGLALAQVQVTVRPVNTPPTVPDQELFRVCCDPIEVDVLEKAIDPDSRIDRSTLEVVSPPRSGTATVNTSNGTITYTPRTGFVGRDAFSVAVRDEEGAESEPATVTLTVGAAGGFINEVVRGESRVEIFNPEATSLDISDWRIAGYRLGSDAARESYVGPVIDGVSPSAVRFHAGTRVVVDLPEANLSTDRVELRDGSGRIRDALQPNLTCYQGSRRLRPSLSRYLDGFDAGDPCLSFRWVDRPTLGAGNQ